jgi:hypothetical protein
VHNSRDRAENNRHKEAYEGMQMGESVFFYLVCEAIGTAATSGLLCQP